MINYEWDVETVDEHGDIQDHQHGDLDYLLSVFGFEILSGEGSTRLVLIRNKENDSDGLTNRQWAYVENSQLPETFDGGATIPATIKKQFNKYS